MKVFCPFYGSACNGMYIVAVSRDLKLKKKSCQGEIFENNTTIKRVINCGTNWTKRSWLAGLEEENKLADFLSFGAESFFRNLSCTEEATIYTEGM